MTPRIAAAVTFLCLAATPLPAIAQGTAQDPEMACIQRCPLVPDSFGTKKADPACVRKCLLTGGGPERAPDLPRVPPPVPPPPARAATSIAIRFTPAWDTSATRRGQKLVIETVVRRLPNGTPANAHLVAAVKKWMLTHVLFDRTSRSSPDGFAPEMRAKSKRLEFDDRFFEIERGRQDSLLMFELGKVLWLRTDPTLSDDAALPADVRAAAMRINALTYAHHNLLLDLKRASYNGESLGALSDGAEGASSWGYALRAIMLGLEPASPAARSEWARVRRDFEREFAALVR